MDNVSTIGITQEQFAQRAALVGSEPPRVEPNAEDKPKGKGKRGRKAKMRVEGGQEKVQDLTALDDKMEHLIDTYNSAKERATDFSEAVKAAAESSGFLTKVVRQLVIAKAGEKFEDRKREVGQLSLLFERE